MRKFYFCLVILLAGCSYQEPSSSMKLKTYSSEDFGISLDSPFPVQFTKDEENKKNGLSVKTLAGEAKNDEPEILDIALFTIRRLTGEKAMLGIFRINLFSADSSSRWNYDSKAILQSTLKILEGIAKKDGCQNFQHQGKPVLCSGMPATLTSGSFKIQRKDMEVPIYFQDLLVVHQKKYWQVYCTYQDQEKYGGIAQQVMQSVKINLKPHASK
jgi:hypothetical protein